jgi:hypothetical protein
VPERDICARWLEVPFPDKEFTMRSLVLSLVLAAASLGLVVTTPSSAQAQWRSWRRGYSYAPAYYYGYPGYTYPSYSYGYSNPSYAYYYTPYGYNYSYYPGYYNYSYYPSRAYYPATSYYPTTTYSPYYSGYYYPY